MNNASSGNLGGKYSQMMSAKLIASQEDQESTSTLRPGITYETEILGFLGILNILGCNYLTVITEADTVGTLYNSKIYKITKVSLLPFN